MAAPALVALAHGSRDPRSAATINALVAEVRRCAPTSRSSARSSTSPSRARHGRRPAGRPAREIVVVPLLLTEAYHAKVDVPRGRRRRARPEGVQIRASPILGLEARFLEVLDLRLREALGRPGPASSTPWCWPPPAPSDPLANQSVARLARCGARTTSCPSRRRSRRPLPRPPARPCAPSAPRAAPHRRRVVLPRARPAARPGHRARRRGRCGGGLRPARAHTPRSPVRSSPATPWARSSSSRSDA